MSLAGWVAVFGGLIAAFLPIVLVAVQDARAEGKGDDAR